MGSVQSLQSIQEQQRNVQDFEKYICENCIEQVIDHCCSLLLSGNEEEQQCISNFAFKNKLQYSVYDFVEFTEKIVNKKLLYADRHLPPIMNDFLKRKCFIAKFTPIRGLILSYPPCANDVIKDIEKIIMRETQKSQYVFAFCTIQKISCCEFLEIVTIPKEYDIHHCAFLFNFTKFFRQAKLKKSHIEQLQTLRDKLFAETISDRNLLNNIDISKLTSDRYEAIYERDKVVEKYDLDEFKKAQAKYENELATLDETMNKLKIIYNKYNKTQNINMKMFTDANCATNEQRIKETFQNIDTFSHNIINTCDITTKYFSNV